MLWLLAGCTGPTAPPAAPLDVVLITLDTTRADALGAYGADPSPSPVFDGLAGRGWVAEEAQTVQPLTLPAHSAILTGRYPHHHGVRDNDGFTLSGDAVTLAEHFQQAGYQTAAFVAASVLDSATGLDQGFDTYEDGFDLTASKAMMMPQWPGEVVRDRAVQWLEAHPEGPRFLWMHLYDAHQPLDAPAAFRARYRDPYVAEVAYADEQVGLLLAELDPATTLVAVVGDHGEGRGEHGENTHGVFVYRSTMRVPLVVAGPKVPVDRIEHPVSVVDVAPTLVKYAGLEPMQGLDGQLLSEPARPVFGESYHPRLAFGMSELRAVQDDAVRYIVAPRSERYAWRDDPAETKNLGPEPTYEALVTGTISGPSKVGHTTDQLAALGYVAPLGMVTDEPYQQLPDPKDQPDMVHMLETLIISARTRPPAQAVPILQAFVKEFPRVGTARVLLARAQMLTGEPMQGVATLEPLLALRPDDPDLLLQRGELLLAAGRPDEAKQVVERARAERPTHPSAYALLGEMRRRAGDCAGAVTLVGEGLAHTPTSSKLLLVRGACLEAQGKRTEAEADLRRVLALDPHNPDVRLTLGLLLARTGRAEEAVGLFRQQLERTPDDPLVAGALGMALYVAGKPEEAVAPLRTAVPHPAAGDEPPLLLADILLKTGGELSEVARLLDLAARRNPGNAQVHKVRADLFLLQGKTQAALKESARFREASQRH